MKFKIKIELGQATNGKYLKFLKIIHSNRLDRNIEKCNPTKMVIPFSILYGKVEEKSSCFLMSGSILSKE